MTVNGKSISITGGDAGVSAIDTGTTLIGGPSDDVAAIWAAVPGSSPSLENPGFFGFRKSLTPWHHVRIYSEMFGSACSTDVTVTVSFGGKAWPISTQDMNTGPDQPGSSTCLGAIFDLTMGTSIPASSGNPSWVFGDTFLVSLFISRTLVSLLMYFPRCDFGSIIEKCIQRFPRVVAPCSRVCTTF